MTMGANELATFDVPKGCTAKRRTRIAQLAPTIVLVLMSGWATSIP